MIESNVTLADVLKKYDVVKCRKPKHGDLVFIHARKAIFEVMLVDGMNVKVTEKQGSGLTAIYPPSHYRLLERKK